MNVTDSTEVRDRLYLREQTLVRIWEYEQEMQRIAGGKLTLTFPNAKARTGGPSNARTRRVEPPKPRVRRLVPGTEDAYRVVMEVRGERVSSMSDNPETIRQLFQITVDCRCRVLQIDTVALDETGDESVVATLYELPSAEH